MVCGETEVTASNLRAFIGKLDTQEDDSETTGFQKHFQVFIDCIHNNTIVYSIFFSDPEKYQYSIQMQHY